jgi:hypothetical protein
MYFDKCPNCDAPYGPCSPRQTATYQSVEVWPSRFDLDHVTCLNCGIVEAGYQPDYDTHRQARWMDGLEVLKPNVDYDYVRSTRRSRLNRRLDVVWMWNPTGAGIHNDAGADVMENEIVRLHLGLPVSRASILIYPHSMDASFAIRRRDLFDEVWQLRSHVTADAAGPYPSLRAERSIMRTLCTQRIDRVFHCWPSATLRPVNRFRPLTNDALLAKWAEYARSHHLVTVNH